jgi:hypothetical protein
MGLMAKKSPKTGFKTKRAGDKVRKKVGKPEKTAVLQRQNRHKTRVQARGQAQARLGACPVSRKTTWGSQALRGLAGRR